jgi:hypothetical protein
MPGLKKVGNVTMKKGIFKGDAEFCDWFSQIKMNPIQRRPTQCRIAWPRSSACSTMTPSPCRR